ncbi:MAG: UvrD-helicase domain-containing protein [Candidatus Shapirobacteria bacterium]|jgi:DNA helicase-2/ATP-dependent DNA helicase PcrA
MSDILQGLNPQQKKAVVHQGTPLLLLAGAGSGKTRVLTHRAAYLIANHLASASDILLLTFTNKAAAEMKSRISALFKANRLKSDTGLFAGTFHSFCCRILRHDGTHIGVAPNFVIYDQEDQQNLIKTILKELNLTPKEFSPVSIAYFIEQAKNNFQTPQSLSVTGFWQSYAQKIYSQYQKKLSDLQALDFNDLLFKTVELLLSHQPTLEKYQNIFHYILVDEYQDTNQIQYLLTKLLAKKLQQITAVGDASQAIYGWRGADFRNLISFTTDFKNTTIINLEQNYRSTQNILEAANSVISKNTSHPVLHLYTNKVSQDKIHLFQANSEVDEADYVAQKIQFIHLNLRLPYKYIAVLYRMNAQSRVIEEAFLRQSIPYVLVGGLRFYERAEIKDILSMLRLAVNSKDLLSADRLEKNLGKKKFGNFLAHLSAVDLPSLTSIQILESLVVASGYLDKFDHKDEEDQRRIENIKELKSVATAYPDIHQFLENISLVQQEYSLQEKNKKKENREGVRLMTLHGSKGLEFEVVFLVGFEEGILPHLKSMVETADIEEERRLCYVGITRAKDYLFITYANRRLYFGKSSLNAPSRFLSEIPQNLLEFETPSSGDLHQPAGSNDSDLVYDPDIY